MKKILYLIPLLFLFFIPRNAFAIDNDYTNTYLYPSNLTQEQKDFMLNTVQNDSLYLTYTEEYSYHLVSYFNSVPYQYDYVGNYVIVIYYNEIPELSDFVGMVIQSDLIQKVVVYDFNLENNTYSLFMDDFFPGMFKFVYMDTTYSVENMDIVYACYLDYYLYSNFDLRPIWNFNLYDLNGNLIKTYTTEDSLLNAVEEEKEYSLNNILKSEDFLYSLSKDLIGPLPEEFTFLYSICQLFLGLVIILVVLSPIILLLRLFR